MREAFLQASTVVDPAEPRVARHERQGVLLLSTFTRHVQARGGALDLMAQFPGQEPAPQEGPGDIVEFI